MFVDPNETGTGTQHEEGRGRARDSCFQRRHTQQQQQQQQHSSSSNSSSNAAALLLLEETGSARSMPLNPQTADTVPV